MQFPQPFRAAPVAEEVEEPDRPPCDTIEGQQRCSKGGRFKWAAQRVRALSLTGL